MEEFIIEGGRKLYGTIEVPAAKNAVLPIIAGCILTDEEVIIKRTERLADIDSMLKIIEDIGGTYCFDGGDLHIRCENLHNHKIDSKLTGVLRSSIFVLGPMLARMKIAEISYPGGCDIGLRPIDLHLYGLKCLGVETADGDGLIRCDGRRMSEARINLDFPSVGATENIMMAASLTPGTTIIHNAAAEPEIVDLQNFINAMGGCVSGAGSRSVTVTGVEKLHGCVYTPISDRIAAGTYLIGGAMCGGEVTVSGVDSASLFPLTEKLKAAGCAIVESLNSVTVRSDGRLHSVPKTETRPYPGFPTDLQAQFVSMLSVCAGTSVMVENLFENRFRHTVQLCKMGANITVCGRAAVVRGVKVLRGTDVLAEDLRGGAALVLAALSAKGITTVRGLKHIDRGYYLIEDVFASLGGNIRRGYFVE